MTRSGWRWLRLALAVAWVLMSAAAFTVVGQHQSTLPQLEEAIDSGDVGAVTVLGDGLSPESRGYTVTTLRWRDGSTRYTAEVIEAQPLTAAPGRNQRNPGTVVVGDVVEQLTALDPTVDVARVALDHPPDGSTFLRLVVPPWFGFTAVGLSLLTLWLLISGPEPWRATRWAWFWLFVGFTPLGIAAFLLLSGPPLTPRKPSRRLTGGWAFLLALVLGSAYRNAKGG